MALQWSPPVAISPAETRILAKCKKSRLFIFLREVRHELFDAEFQRELASMYPERARGREPVAPAMLAMVTLLQAANGVSDEDAIEFAALDRRWQMLLDCLDREDAPFSQGTLFKFRQRLIAADLDQRLLQRTIELARRTQLFGDRALKAAFDASPLFGAGRVEDTFNLIGHAARDVLRSVARRLDLSLEEAAHRAGIPVLTGSSVKAALDVDWDDSNAKKDALSKLLAQVHALESFIASELALEAQTPPLSDQLATLRTVINQDLEPDPNGSGQRIKKGVAKNRRISIVDPDMAHGRKSKSTRVDGYKRHVAVDLDSKLILTAAITSANRPEAEATSALLEGVQRCGGALVELHIDRGYLPAPEIAQERENGVLVQCKPFPLRNGGRFTKADFKLDLDNERVECPAGQVVPLRLGEVSRFDAKACASCATRAQCTTATKGGRALAIHPAEDMLLELRERRSTRAGREALRERTYVEHALAAVGRSQTNKARYTGKRMNLLDLYRHAAVANLHTLARAA